MGKDEKKDELELSFGEQEIAVLDSIQESFEEEAKEEEIFVKISNIGISKLKAFNTVLEGYRNVKAKRRNIRIYLKDDFLEKVSNIADRITLKEETSLKVKGILDKKSTFDNVFSVSEMDEIDDIE